jgi:hypothetical protein
MAKLYLVSVILLVKPRKVMKTRGPRAWRSADDFEEMEIILNFFRKYAA